MPAVQNPALSPRDFKSFQQMIYDLAGISLSDSKTVLVQSRLAKRLRALSLETYHHYWEYLNSGESHDETTQFINCLTTNKTEFFREEHHFDYLRETILPELSKQKIAEGSRTLRVWCSASSTGEEPYTIAMTLREYFGPASGWDIKILASDIDTDVLETASQGVYSAQALASVPRPLVAQYFEPASSDNKQQLRAKRSLRDLITFRRINLQHENWPINTQFDVIFCRNVMIYFNETSQAKLIARFAGKLRPQAHLIIGHSETLNGRSQDFDPLGNTIYRLKPSYVSTAKSPVMTGRPTLSAASELPRSMAKKEQLPPAKDVSNIIVGEICVRRDEGWVKTVLGSCVATCLYDEKAGVGGMNHFRLPDSNSLIDASPSLGVHAMELLINEIMKNGGDRRRLKAKFFGGGSVLSVASRGAEVGARNIEFAEKFLETEQIPVVSQYTGGDAGMQVYFNTRTAKVFVKLLDRTSSVAVDQEESRQADSVNRLKAAPVAVTLF